MLRKTCRRLIICGDVVRAVRFALDRADLNHSSLGFGFLQQNTIRNHEMSFVRTAGILVE